MKIRQKKEEETIEFEKVENGTVFRWRGELYMKMEVVFDEYDDPCNSVRLSDGDSEFHLTDTEPVQVVNGEFVEKGAE